MDELDYELYHIFRHVYNENSMDSCINEIIGLLREDYLTLTDLYKAIDYVNTKMPQYTEFLNRLNSIKEYFQTEYNGEYIEVPKIPDGQYIPTKKTLYDYWDSALNNFIQTTAFITIPIVVEVYELVSNAAYRKMYPVHRLKTKLKYNKRREIEPDFYAFLTTSEQIAYLEKYK